MSDGRRERRHIDVPAGPPVKQGQRNRAVLEPLLGLYAAWDEENGDASR